MTQPTISAERIEEMLAGLAYSYAARTKPSDDELREVLTLSLSALRAQAQGSEAVAVWKHLPDGNNWLVVQPKFRGITWPAEVPLYASPPVQAQPQGCATEGCENQCVTHYEAGGVGSYYCEWCLRKVKALATPPAPVDGDDLALLDLVREEAARNNSPLGRSDAAALYSIRNLLGLDRFTGAALTASRAAVAQDETP